MTDERIFELAKLNCSYDQSLRTIDFARAIEREVLSQAVVAQHHLSNLLARIHRDGGHYEIQHGTDKAVADADLIVARLNMEKDQAVVAQPPSQRHLENTAEENERLRERMPKAVVAQPVDVRVQALQDCVNALFHSRTPLEGEIAIKEMLNAAKHSAQAKAGD